MKLNAIELPPRAPGLSRTLVLLHGYGADERDLLPIAHELDPRLRAISLQGPIALSGPMLPSAPSCVGSRPAALIEPGWRGKVQCHRECAIDLPPRTVGHCFWPPSLFRRSKPANSCRRSDSKWRIS